MQLIYHKNNCDMVKVDIFTLYMSLCLQVSQKSDLERVGPPPSPGPRGFIRTNVRHPMPAPVKRRGIIFSKLICYVLI